MENRIMCPIINGEIEDIECFDMCMVSEGLAPERTARNDMVSVGNYEDICINCKNHKE